MEQLKVVSDVEALMTVPEAAEYLRMSVHWVYKATASGVLPCLKVGRSTKFRRSQLDAWLEKQRSGDRH